jgi:hypothetical protein
MQPCERLGHNMFMKLRVTQFFASCTLVCVPRYYVSDLAHFVDDQGRAVGGPLGKLGRYLGLIVESASRLKQGHAAHIPMRCSNPVRRKRCSGQLTASLAAHDSIEWSCTSCGEAGHITNWVGTEFDLGPAQDIHVFDAQRDVVVPLDELDAMRRTGRGSRSMRQRMAEAIRVSEQHCYFLGTEHELLRMKEYALVSANVARAEDRRWLDRFAGRLDAHITTLASFIGGEDPERERLLN